MLEVSILLNELNWSVQNFGINSLLKQQSISFFEFGIFITYPTSLMNYDFHGTFKSFETIC